MTIIFKDGHRRPDWHASTTLNDRYHLDEVLSAVIKEIRRGDQEAATFWSLQMMHAGEVAADFLWESLAICSIEDVGLAEPSAINVVMSSKKLYDSLPVGYVARGLAVTFVAVYLSNCKKSRLVDEMLIDMLHRFKHDSDQREIPDYALDHHTHRGRAMGRGEHFFHTVATELVNEIDTTKIHFNNIMERLMEND